MITSPGFNGVEKLRRLRGLRGLRRLRRLRRIITIHYSPLTNNVTSSIFFRLLLTMRKENCPMVMVS